MRSELLAGVATALAGALLALSVAMPALAEETGGYPTRPVSVVVSFAPGGAADTAVRAVVDSMAHQLGQPLVVENRPGASGTIGAEYVSRAAPDGYTLGAVGLATGVIPHLMGPLPRYGFDDFVYVGQLSFAEFVIVARPDLQADSIAQLLELSAARADELSYGESGPATQLAAEWFKRMTGLRALRVPYKGDAPALADLIGGHIDLALVSLSSAAPQLRAGTVKAIALASSKRSTAFPGIPTVDEAVPGYEAGGPTMLAAPRGTPPAVIERVNAALNRALEDPALQRRFAAMGLGVARMTPGQAGQYMNAEYAKWKRVIDVADIPTNF